MQRRNSGRGRWRPSRLAPSLAIFPQLRRQRNLRVCPGSCSFLTELSQHEADRGEAQECQGLSVEALPILGQAAAAVDDLQVDLPEDFAKGRLKDRPLKAAAGIELQGRGAASLEYRLGCGASC